jgi:YHS domain-containing protein
MARLALYAGLAVIVALVITVWMSGIRSRARRAGSGERRDTMVLDPVCSTYLPKSRAVVRRFEGADVCFCSEACAEQYTRHRGGMGDEALHR